MSANGRPRGGLRMPSCKLYRSRNTRREGLGEETAGVAATTLDWSEAPAAKDGLLIQSESRAQVESSQTKPCLPRQAPRFVSRSGVNSPN